MGRTESQTRLEQRTAGAYWEGLTGLGTRHGTGLFHGSCEWECACLSCLCGVLSPLPTPACPQLSCRVSTWGRLWP